MLLALAADAGAAGHRPAWPRPWERIRSAARGPADEPAVRDRSLADRPGALVGHRRHPAAAGRAPVLHRAGAADRAGHRAAARAPGSGTPAAAGSWSSAWPTGCASLPELGLLMLLVLAMGIGLVPVTIALAVLGDPAAAGRHLRRGAQRRPGGRRRRPGDGHARVAGAVQGRAAERAAADPRRPARRRRCRSSPPPRSPRTSASGVWAGSSSTACAPGTTRRWPPARCWSPLLALLVEAVLALVQRQIVSPGLRAGGGARRSPTAEVARSNPTRGSSPTTTPELAGAPR